MVSLARLDVMKLVVLQQLKMNVAYVMVMVSQMVIVIAMVTLKIVPVSAAAQQL